MQPFLQQPALCAEGAAVLRKASAVGERHRGKGEECDEQIHGDKVPQEGRIGLARRGITHKEIGRKEVDDGDDEIELLHGMEEPAGVVGVEHGGEGVLRAAEIGDGDEIETDEDEGEKEEKGHLPEIAPSQAVQAQEQSEQRTCKEQCVAEVIAEDIPRPEWFADEPMGDGHGDDPRKGAEEGDEVLPGGTLEEKDDGRGDDEKGAEIVCRNEQDVEFLPPILRIEEGFEEVLQQVDEHEGKDDALPHGERAVPQQEVCSRHKYCRQKGIEKVCKISVLQDHKRPSVYSIALRTKKSNHLKAMPGCREAGASGSGSGRARLFRKRQANGGGFFDNFLEKTGKTRGIF